MQIVEAGAEGQDHVRIAAGFGCRILAPYPGHAEIEPMIAGQRALAHERRIDRHFQLFGKRLSVPDRHRPRRNAAAGQDQRTLGDSEQIKRPFHGISETLERQLSERFVDGSGRCTGAVSI